MFIICAVSHALLERWSWVGSDGRGVQVACRWRRWEINTNIWRGSLHRRTNLGDMDVDGKLMRRYNSEFWREAIWDDTMTMMKYLLNPLFMLIRLNVTDNIGYQTIRQKAGIARSVQRLAADWMTEESGSDSCQPIFHPIWRLTEIYLRWNKAAGRKTYSYQSSSAYIKNPWSYNPAASHASSWIVA
jgi:hypothetical protein